MVQDVTSLLHPTSSCIDSFNYNVKVVDYYYDYDCVSSPIHALSPRQPYEEENLVFASCVRTKRAICTVLENLDFRDILHTRPDPDKLFIDDLVNELFAELDDIDSLLSTRSYPTPEHRELYQDVMDELLDHMEALNYTLEEFHEPIRILP